MGPIALLARHLESGAIEAPSTASFIFPITPYNRHGIAAVVRVIILRVKQAGSVS